MSDLIDRQAAIDECYPITVDGEVYEVVQVETLMGLPSAQPRCYLGSPCEYQNAEIRLPTAEPHNMDEWCDDCKEYDHEKHCCPRFNRVIRTAMEEANGECNGI